MSADEREALIRDLFPLVKTIAGRVHRLLPSCSRDDLVGDGCVGLIRAVDAFDPARGIPLEHYAARVIAGAMLNGVRRLDPVPERIRREVREADRERYAQAACTGSLPSLQSMEQQRPLLRRALTLANRYTPLSLDAPLPQNESVCQDEGADPAVIAAERARRQALHDAVRALPARHRRIVVLHYFAGRSLRQIGALMEISPQRASQLHLSAVHKLRHCLHAAH